VTDVLGDGGEHLRRRPPASHERRDPPLRCEHRLVIASQPLLADAILGVGERHNGTATLRHLARHRSVGDGQHRAVAPNELVQIARDDLARRPSQQHRGLRSGIGRPVLVPAVDRPHGCGARTARPRCHTRAQFAAGFANGSHRRDRTAADSRRSVYVSAIGTTLGDAYSEPAADVRGYVASMKAQTA
jgi:hypothetical protein